MVTYPIHVPRKRYRGTNERLTEKTISYNELASLLEAHINKKIKDGEGEVHQFLYWSLASELNLDEKEVRDILFGVDCGHNGLTVSKPMNKPRTQ